MPDLIQGHCSALAKWYLNHGEITTHGKRRDIPGNITTSSD